MNGGCKQVNECLRRKVYRVIQETKASEILIENYILKNKRGICKKE